MLESKPHLRATENAARSKRFYIHPPAPKKVDDFTLVIEPGALHRSSLQVQLLESTVARHILVAGPGTLQTWHVDP